MKVARGNGLLCNSANTGHFFSEVNEGEEKEMLKKRKKGM